MAAIWREWSGRSFAVRPPYLLALAAAVVLMLAGATPTGAVIKRIYPLEDIIGDADVIQVRTVTTRDVARKRVSLAVSNSLKGKSSKDTLSISLSGGDNKSQMLILEERLPPGRQVVLFGKTRRFMLGYSNGTWFRLAEPAAGKPWQFVHLELYLTRTFRGSTSELIQTLTSVLAGKAKAPEPAPEVPPGYGPK